MAEAEELSLVVGICDDSEADLKKYKQLIAQAADQHKIAVSFLCFKNGEELLFWMEEQKELIDVLYLDIFMGVENGISVARQLRDRNSSVFYDGKIIFLTKSDQFAIDAFDVGAFHYIIKGRTEQQKFNEIFLNAAENIRKSKQKQLMIRGIGEYRNIEIDTIYYFEVVHRIITVHYGRPEHVFEFYSTMEKLEENMLPFGFLRVQRSFIVNVNRIISLSRSGVVLDNARNLPVGRNYYPVLKKAFDDISLTHTYQ